MVIKVECLLGKNSTQESGLSHVREKGNPDRSAIRESELEEDEIDVLSYISLCILDCAYRERWYRFGDSTELGNFLESTLP